MIFRILERFWKDSRRILEGFWEHSGVRPRPGSGPVPVQFQGPKKCQKCLTVIKNRAQAHLPAAAGTRFGGHPGSRYLTLLEPYSVPLLGKTAIKRVPLFRF